MSIGAIFLLIALVLFFLNGAAILPVPIVWGLFCLTLGILLSGVNVPWKVG